MYSMGGGGVATRIFHCLAHFLAHRGYFITICWMIQLQIGPTSVFSNFNPSSWPRTTTEEKRTRQAPDTVLPCGSCLLVSQVTGDSQNWWDPGPLLLLGSIAASHHSLFPSTPIHSTWTLLSRTNSSSSSSNGLLSPTAYQNIGKEGRLRTFPRSILSPFWNFLKAPIEARHSIPSIFPFQPLLGRRTLGQFGGSRCKTFNLVFSAALDSLKGVTGRLVSERDIPRCLVMGRTSAQHRGAIALSLQVV